MSITNHVRKIDEAVLTYEKIKFRYEQFTVMLVNLIENLISDKKIHYDHIESRTKTTKSFREKLIRKSYDNPFLEIPDLSGIRIVLYYIDDISIVGKIIEDNFTVIKSESSDKAMELGVNEFGYQSHHYVIQLPRKRSELPEWRPLRAFTAEIQVRTVLQHAWASVSHAIQYKKEDIPANIARELYRVSSFLEEADLKFNMIKNETKKYEETVVSSSNHDLLKLAIDRVSLIEFLARSSLIETIQNTAKKLGFQFVEDIGPNINKDCIAELAWICSQCNIDTIKQLEDFIKKITPTHDIVLSELISQHKGWRVDPVFIVRYLLINLGKSHFSKEILLSRRWDKSVLEKIYS